MSNPKPSVAFVGMGIMGKPMAGHLLTAGYPLTVHSHTQSRAEDLLARGAKWASSAAEAARGAEVVFVCVPDTPDVEEVVVGKGGIVESAREGLIVVDHSTISPTATRRMAGRLKEKGTVMLDAPVSGGDVGAQKATLSIMVGGEEEAFKMVEPMLRVMGKTITYCGKSGAGQLTKLTNQILVSLTNLAVCEALTFALGNGLDAEKTIQAVGAGAGGSWQLSNLGPKMVKGDFSPGFMIDLQVKDLRLVEEAMREAGMELEGSEVVRRLFEKAQDEGWGREGTQALFKAVRGGGSH